MLVLGELSHLGQDGALPALARKIERCDLNSIASICSTIGPPISISIWPTWLVRSHLLPSPNPMSAKASSARFVTDDGVSMRSAKKLIFGIHMFHPSKQGKNTNGTNLGLEYAPFQTIIKANNEIIALLRSKPNRWGAPMHKYEEIENAVQPQAGPVGAQGDWPSKVRKYQTIEVEFQAKTVGNISYKINPSERPTDTNNRSSWWCINQCTETHVAQSRAIKHCRIEMCRSFNLH